MADIWSLDIFRFTPRSYLIAIGYESLHSSMVPAQFLYNFSGLFSSALSETTNYRILVLFSGIFPYLILVSSDNQFVQ